MAADDRSIVLGPGEGRTIPVLGDRYTYKLTSADTGGAYALLDITTMSDGPPLHVHKAEDEAFYVLEGELRVQVGERIIHGTAGAFVFIPKGTAHTFAKAGTEPARMLVIISPAGFEQFFEEVGGPPDMDKIMAAAERYGFEVVGPPLEQ